MTAIDNDTAFKQALEALPPEVQRRVASRFVESVLDLCPDLRVRQAAASAGTQAVPIEELQVAYRGAKAASAESYTACGHEADWLGQAGHFVAAASAAATQPEAADPWRAAMCARMARTCEMIAHGSGGTHTEAEQQYRLLAELQTATHGGPS